jgi:hypothetical protein
MTPEESVLLAWARPAEPLRRGRGRRVSGDHVARSVRSRNCRCVREQVAGQALASKGTVRYRRCVDASAWTGYLPEDRDRVGTRSPPTRAVLCPCQPRTRSCPPAARSCPPRPRRAPAARRCARQQLAERRSLGDVDLAASPAPRAIADAVALYREPPRYRSPLMALGPGQLVPDVMGYPAAVRSRATTIAAHAPVPAPPPAPDRCGSARTATRPIPDRAGQRRQRTQDRAGQR